MAERTDATVFAMQAVQAATTPTERARGYRTLADMFEASLITHATAQKLMDALDRRAQMSDVLGLDSAEMVN